MLPLTTLECQSSSEYDDESVAVERSENNADVYCTVTFVRVRNV